MTKCLLQDFWAFVETEKEKSKTAERVYNWLNYDNLSGIIIDGNAFWLEKNWSGATIPNYAFDYIEKYCNKKGFTYLYKI